MLKYFVMHWNAEKDPVFSSCHCFGVTECMYLFYEGRMSENVKIVRFRVRKCTGVSCHTRKLPIS